MTMMAVMRHPLLRWTISSSDAMVAERSDIREMTVLARNKATAAVAAVVLERDRTKTKETATIAVSKAILRPSVGRIILRPDRHGACIEILVLLVEGLSIEKDQLSFTDFNFINETLDLN